MQVAERNHASLRVHVSACAFPSIEDFFNFLTWILAQRAISPPYNARVCARAPKIPSNLRCSKVMNFPGTCCVIYFLTVSFLVFGCFGFAVFIIPQIATPLLHSRVVSPWGRASIRFPFLFQSCLSSSEPPSSTSTAYLSNLLTRLYNFRCLGDAVMLEFTHFLSAEMCRIPENKG